MCSIQISVRALFQVIPSQRSLNGCSACLGLGHSLLLLLSRTSFLSFAIEGQDFDTMSNRRRERIPDAEWNSHKEMIRQLYLEGDKRLEGPGGVMEVMASTHNFSAR